MVELDIPGRGVVRLVHLVSDVNGTLALDGRLIDGAAKKLLGLTDRLQIHLLTADTHGQQATLDRQLGLTAVVIPRGGEAEAKALYVRGLGAQAVVAIGQGANDAGMLREAAIGIGILGPEGLAAPALVAADVLVASTLEALDLLYHPLRLVATLRQ